VHLAEVPEGTPIEIWCQDEANIWQYMRANWLSNRVFETYDAIIDAACEAWRKLIAQPDTITSIGMRTGARRSIPMTVGIIATRIDPKRNLDQGTA